MRIERLEARGFRNLAPLSLTFEEAAAVFRGPNAQGKTNLLEALYVCATGRSFRHAAPRELVHHDAAAARLSSRFERQGVRHDVEVSITRERRSMQVDGRALQQTSRLLQLVNVVAFFPDDLRIAKGSPEERRRFLDRVVGNYRPDFVDAASAYAKALRSRNALLKAKEAPDPALLAVYDEQLLRHGAAVHAGRRAALAALLPAAARYFAEVMDGARVDVRLTAGLPDDADDVAALLGQALRDSYPRDRARGSTSYGPHRADLHIEVNGRDARLFASQGQQRAAVLALKLAEVETLGAQLGTLPLLLLDDVSSELDAARTRALFETVARLGCQVLVSTTGAAPLTLAGGARVFDVRDGHVVAAKDGHHEVAERVVP